MINDDTSIHEAEDTSRPTSIGDNTSIADDSIREDEPHEPHNISADDADGVTMMIIDWYEAHPWHYDWGEAYYKDTCKKKKELGELAKELGPKWDGELHFSHADHCMFSNLYLNTRNQRVERLVSIFTVLHCTIIILQMMGY